MRDFYPAEMRLRNNIFDAWRAASLRHGFHQYDACVVESLDLMERKAGEEIVDQIYSFKDKSGRRLALRPEITPSLARMIAARQGALTLPLKWFAIAQCFRYERMSRGRKREHYQWNLDIVGEPSVRAESEVLAAAVSALRDLGLRTSEFTVCFSSRALLSDMLAKLGIPPEHRAAAFLCLDKRGKLEDGEVTKLLLDAGLSRAHAEATFELIAVNTLEDAIDLLGSQTPACEQVLEFRELAGTYDLGECIRFDVSVVRGLAYYTGIVFEAFDTARGFRAIFGGGRYDNLLADLGGRPATGVGLGFGDVVVAEILASRKPTDLSPRDALTAIGYMADAQHPTAVRLASALRRAGRNVDLALRTEKARQFFSRCARSDFTEAVYVGPDDVAAGTVRIKNLATREEQEVSLADALRGQAQP
jgi:histidyl-tRNA synthetase